jgi:cytochrome c-type biogenesis protein CcmF
MTSNIGFVSIVISCILSLFILILFLKHVLFGGPLHSKFFALYKASFFLIAASFVLLVISFIISDFSIVAVYENSHTDKPFFYKFAGTWGNHEGSMLLFILIISLYGYLFLLFSKQLNFSLRFTTIFFQTSLQFAFLLFLIFTSNPFEKIFPVPNQGLGLNPILQDPLLVLHPPFLYLGYVGFSLVFSLLLGGLICNYYNQSWAAIAKRWIFLPWTFLTFGIGLGSFWAYYELGWGGYWFWDPVENASLMPWIASTALIHSVLVMDKTKKLYNWTAILTILTFVLSLFGTFLVRSGILNSVHAFANDPERGLYILFIISLITFSALVIYILKSPKQTEGESGFVLFSREFSIVANNYLLIFALTVVTIGTTYPILLSVFTGESISVGPQYYNTILAPFVFIFLIVMAIGPYMKWSKNSFAVSKNKLISFIISSLIVTILVSLLLKNQNFIFILGVSCSLYLIISVLYEFAYFKNIKLKQFNFARVFSHAGFGFLILAITLHYFFSKEFTAKIPLGESATYKEFVIKFSNYFSKEGKNYQELTGEYEIQKNGEKIVLKPSIRRYSQPQQFTSETSIRGEWLSDMYIAMDYTSDTSDGIGIRFYYNYSIRLIWLSYILITIGGLLSFVQRKNEK